MVPCSISYVSPEQVSGKSIDGRSDLFSLGVVLYEMTTGKRPFVGELPAEIINKILNKELYKPKDIDSSIPKPLSNLIIKSLNKSPDERFQTGKEMAEAINKFLETMSIREHTLEGDKKSTINDDDIPPHSRRKLFLFVSLIILIMLISIMLIPIFKPIVEKINPTEPKKALLVVDANQTKADVEIYYSVFTKNKIEENYVYDKKGTNMPLEISLPCGKKYHVRVTNFGFSIETYTFNKCEGEKIVFELEPLINKKSKRLE